MVELEYGHLNSLETCSGEDAKRLQERGDLLWGRVAELSDKKMISDFIFLMHFVEERKLRGEYARKNAQCIQRYGRVLMDRVFTTRPEREALINILRCVRKYPDGRVDEERDTDYVRLAVRHMHLEVQSTAPHVEEAAIYGYVRPGYFANRNQRLDSGRI